MTAGASIVVAMATGCTGSSSTELGSGGSATTGAAPATPVGTRPPTTAPAGTLPPGTTRGTEPSSPDSSVVDTTSSSTTTSLAITTTTALVTTTTQSATTASTVPIKAPVPFTIGLTPDLVAIASYVDLRYGAPATLDVNLVTRAARGGGASPTDAATDWTIAPDCITTQRTGTSEPTVDSFWPADFPVWPGRPTHFGVGIARASSNGTHYARLTVCFATYHEPYS